MAKLFNTFDGTWFTFRSGVVYKYEWKCYKKWTII